MTTKPYVYVFEYKLGKPEVMQVDEKGLHEAYRVLLLERWKLVGGWFPPTKKISEYSRVIGEMKRDLQKLGILETPVKEDFTPIDRAAEQ